MKKKQERKLTKKLILKRKFKHRIREGEKERFFRNMAEA